MLAFNGTFTIMNSKTGVHRTFRIRTQPMDAGFAPGKRVIGMLTGPNNEEDYTSFGFVEDKGISVWRRHSGTASAPSFYDQCARMVWSLGTDNNSPYLTLGVTFEVSKRCRICNRTLTNPLSLETGIGPECERKLNKPVRTIWLEVEEQL